jgi:DNA-binding MarR family transcriptional regulator
MRRIRQTTSDATPQGGLHEGGIHRLLGYQLAQAVIPTTGAFDEVVGGPLDLCPVEFTILQLVHENPSVTATNVAKALAVTTPGVTVRLDRLEQRGLLECRRDEKDRRTQDLSVTSHGETLVSSALEQLLNADRELLAPLSEGERHMLLKLLHKFARARAR